MLLKSKIIISITVISFLTNLVWENLHAPLYKENPNFWICLRASIGDVVIILLIYVAIAIVNKNILWIKTISKTEIILSLLLGITIALGFEWLALSMNRWHYNATMPIIPVLNVGLSPVLQMIILPIATFYITHKIFIKAVTRR